MGNRYFWLCCFVFLASLSIWVRGDLFGFDSYATWNAIKYDIFEPLNNQLVANIVWGLLPDSLLVFKALMFLSLFFTIVPIWLLIGNYYGERLAWISVFLLMGLSPILLFSFGEFENEILAYPFLIWGVYWFLTCKDWKGTIQSIVSVLVGTIFWLWPGYLLWLNNGSSGVLETQLFAGLWQFWFLLPFIFGIFLIKRQRVLVLGTLFVCLTLWNFKLFILLIPILGLSVANAWILFEKYDFVKKMLLYLAFFGLFAVNIAFVMQSPTQNDWILVNEAVELQKDTNFPLYVDLGFEYWTIHKTGVAFSYNQVVEHDWNYYKKPFIGLTKSDLNCLEIKKFESQIKKATIWLCN